MSYPWHLECSSPCQRSLWMPKQKPFYFYWKNTSHSHVLNLELFPSPNTIRIYRQNSYRNMHIYGLPFCGPFIIPIFGQVKYKWYVLCYRRFTHFFATEMGLSNIRPNYACSSSSTWFWLASFSKIRWHGRVFTIKDLFIHNFNLYRVGRGNLYTFISLKCTNFLGPPGIYNKIAESLHLMQSTISYVAL